ncbi:hypothetical protein NOF04DRAFT_9482 [Fusarium oxysporum II5]|uniref:C2H2-type domain-containing protein n=2 Tax=Fusarium oxysporum species complex TaxID=171631 RepID=X0JKH9_FUSO5|nr:uncharacterized protein FOIG_11169 [Fusarium odoratissimum NRRL 54006]EXL96810.1 hypothetical protein FOIG_11169 [Fusarium odoratissimum NRRL 54006]KAK2136037.1 hypothetical protein NOF04DRAFT_9482 [Fusarium oxysporum II5]TXC04448.1 hypothetical protein FocTR4_00000152 [Fusarium oxysporum f. sp. cubense]
MSCQTNTSTQQVTRENADKSSNRQGCGFSCDQCNASFNRLAHLRRHELTHGSEKPYNCMYCSLTSSRKDVIVQSRPWQQKVLWLSRQASQQFSPRSCSSERIKERLCASITCHDDGPRTARSSFRRIQRRNRGAR